MPHEFYNFSDTLPDGTKVEFFAIDSEPLAKKVTQWDEYSGRFEAVARVEVRARVSGFIDNLHFKDGQWVNAGDPLFTIDRRPYEIAVESAPCTGSMTE
jgi:acetyl/propionyl-CoA carboxylase alpha subunit